MDKKLGDQDLYFVLEKLIERLRYINNKIFYVVKHFLGPIHLAISK